MASITRVMDFFLRCLDLAAQGPSAKSSFRQLPSCCLQDFNTMSDSTTESLNEFRHFNCRRARDHRIQLRKRRRLHLGRQFCAILCHLVFYAAQAALGPESSSQRKQKTVYGVAILCLVSCIFSYDLEGGAFKPFRQMRMEIQQYPHNLRASLSGRNLVSPGIAAEYRAVESALPAGATALDISIDSFLFADTAHKRILLDDSPGAAGPAPGWPLTQGPEAVAEILLRNSVRYVIYDYQYADWSSRFFISLFQVWPISRWQTRSSRSLAL